MSEVDSEKTDFELDWIYAQYQEGTSVADIAKELGKSEAYVYAHMKRKPEKYEDVKCIREENHSLRIRRIRGLADKIVLEYLEKLAGQKDLGPADIDRANRISKDYDHRVLLAEGKNTENIGVGGTGITMIVRKTYPDKETAENACDD
jgi:hypothetical protein